MIQEEDVVSLLNLGRGAAIERFDDELQRVLNNIVDPNTTEQVREVNLKVKIKPNGDRDFCTVDVLCSSKLAPSEPFQTRMFVGRTNKGAVATEHNPQQLQLEMDQANKPSVVPIRKEGQQ